MNRFIKRRCDMKAAWDFIKKLFSEIFSDKKRRMRFIIACVAVALAVSAVVAVLVYVGDYYRADGEAIAAFSDSIEAEITVTREGGVITYAPAGARVGLIFYPGGKVEYTAYEPLMLSLAEWGIFTVLVEMPCNLAVLDMNRADGIIESFPEIESWYIGGHSLGGSMAASYIEKHSDSFEGLLLLASYSTADLSALPINVISLYGTSDGVMNREKYEACRENLPKGFTEYVIEGGNHAYFGMYGEQSGDGAAAITAEAQIRYAAEHIARTIFNKE